MVGFGRDINLPLNWPIQKLEGVPSLLSAKVPVPHIPSAYSSQRRP